MLRLTLTAIHKDISLFLQSFIFTLSNKNECKIDTSIDDNETQLFFKYTCILIQHNHINVDRILDQK